MRLILAAAGVAAAGVTFFLVRRRRKCADLHGCKLTYFPVTSRGESVRLALALSGIPFEDVRIPLPQWRELKPTTPWGTLPVLELADGTVVGQSRAITRLVAKGTGLYPDDEVLAAFVDECMDGADDIMSVTYQQGAGLSGAEKIAKRAAACLEGGATYVSVQRCEKLYERIGAAGPLLTGELTVADLYLFSSVSHIICGFMDGVTPEFLVAFPRVQAVCKAVATLPKLVAYWEAEAKLPYMELNVGGTLVSSQYTTLLEVARGA